MAAALPTRRAASHLLAKLAHGATTTDNASAAIAAQRALAELVAKEVQELLESDGSWQRMSADERASSALSSASDVASPGRAMQRSPSQPHLGALAELQYPLVQPLPPPAPSERGPDAAESRVDERQRHEQLRRSLAELRESLRGMQRSFREIQRRAHGSA